MEEVQLGLVQEERPQWIRAFSGHSLAHVKDTCLKQIPIKSHIDNNRLLHGTTSYFVEQIAV